ncbi:hypothetical protein L7F22_050563 [Adiantum nelumboides]|nr:hypothetical protein [Adiantum nelumboides]
MHNVVEPLPLDIHVERDVHVEAAGINNQGQEALHHDIQRSSQRGKSEDDEVDVFANKRTSAQRLESEGHLKEERARSKLRRDEDKGKTPMEEGERIKQAKARARSRKICMDAFQLGKGQPPYDLLEDLKNKRADISYGQLLHLSSSMRRHWHKLASIRRVKVKLPHAHVVQLHKVTNVLPVVDAWIHGRRFNKAYMDGGAQDWHRGCIDLFVDRPKDKRIRCDMKTCKVLEIDDEPVMHQELSSSTHDMYDNYSCASSTCTNDEVYDQSLLDLDVDLCGIHVSTKNGEKEGAKNSKFIMRMIMSQIVLFDKYPKFFAKDQMSRKKSILHEIKLKEGVKPTAQKLRRLGTIQKQMLELEVSKLLKAGFIYPVDDVEWIFHIVIVLKEGNRWRICVNYKPLNAATKRHHYPLPFQDEILDTVAGHERMIHAQSLDVVFKLIDDDGDQLNPSKCRIARARVVLLGHEISENGIALDRASVECLLMMESPKSTKEFMSFLQKLRYLSRSFCMLAEYVHPLQKATQKDPLVWTKYEQEAFKNVKDKLSTLPIIMPSCWNDMFYLSLSVGEHAIGAILMQKGKEQSYMRPVYYISKVKNDVEQT